MGEVVTGTNAREHFAVDGSILQVAPQLILYPKNENDIRKSARFSWQLAERGRLIPLIARGQGTDHSGGAIGNGILIVLSAHLNKIVELDTKHKTVTVQAGINYAKLQQTLITHGLFLPPYPPSLDYSTIGGAIGNNSGGEKSVKYGSTLNYVKGLRVILANGEVIETRRLSKRELSKKLGLASFEGEIYRSIDTLLEEQNQLIGDMARGTSSNSAGFDLLSIKHKDGSFDLSPLFIGSQGTLGIVSEATLKTEPYAPETFTILAQFNSIEHLQRSVLDLKQMSDPPASIELIDKHALIQIDQLNPNLIKDILKPPFFDYLLVIEFEDGKNAKKATKKALHILNELAIKLDSSDKPEEQLNYKKIRDSVNVLLANNDGLLNAVPLFNGSVPPDRLREYIEGMYKLISSNHLKPALWGHIGEGQIQFQPKLNLGHVGDRQKAFRMIDEYVKLVLDLNGTIAASNAEGRLYAPYVEKMYGEEIYKLLIKVKKIFDPYNILNSGVKLGTDIDDLKAIVRPGFNLGHVYNHLPRS